jgi:hypothetical protein
VVYGVHGTSCLLIDALTGPSPVPRAVTPRTWSPCSCAGSDVPGMAPNKQNLLWTSYSARVPSIPAR